MATIISNVKGSQRGTTDDKPIGIKTQQGFSFHILWLSDEDAQIYADLLQRNNIWYDVLER